MRINKYVALATGMSRRAADHAIDENRIHVNGEAPSVGQDITADDSVTLDGAVITTDVGNHTIMLNKPASYVCSRNGQGSKTVYDLLPAEYHNLKPVGRLDKDSSGLLLLTNDGTLAHELTHPSKQKQKVYEVTLDKPLQPLHQQIISDRGVMLDDGVSKFEVAKVDTQAQHEEQAELQGVAQESEFTSDSQRRGEPLLVTMREGRNRQIRRTFAALGYDVTRLHRTHFGPYTLGNLAEGELRAISLSSR